MRLVTDGVERPLLTGMEGPLECRGGRADWKREGRGVVFASSVIGFDFAGGFGVLGGAVVVAEASEIGGEGGVAVLDAAEDADFEGGVVITGDEAVEVGDASDTGECGAFPPVASSGG